MAPSGRPRPEASRTRLAHLLSRCRFPGHGAPLTCAVSGGADSLALLVLAVEAGCRVTAVHVDHGLRPGSASEADVVASAAARFGADFRSERVQVAPGPNLEARARAARRAVLPPGAATGHTADDQAETMLLNLVRGAGRDGLAGMRPGTTKPLLAVRRSETHALCAELGLDPIVDPSNLDPSFRRNRVRHELLPLLQSIAQRDVVPVLTRQADLMRDEAEVLDGLASLLDAHDGRALAAAPPPLARRAVRRLLEAVPSDDRRHPEDHRSGHPPDAAAVERVLRVARKQAAACEVPGGVRVRRSGGRLYAERG
ncbi:MAG: tRNA lysidine(34) synthetase TilS [Actinomycetota bacterium]|nr:tRNA lysidine(34) synthetase TilS [Actinomycetota bacterium]